MTKYIVKKSGVSQGFFLGLSTAKLAAENMKRVHPKCRIEIFEEKLVAEFRCVPTLVEVR